MYDNVTGSLLRLLSMRLALQFSIAAPAMSRTLQKEDEKLKRAIVNHHKKLSSMEQVKYAACHFSEFVSDLIAQIGQGKQVKVTNVVTQS